LRFLDSPGFKDGSTKLTVLVRNTDYAEKFKSMGVEVAVGSIADEELITRLSAAADVVLSMVGEIGCGISEVMLTSPGGSQ